MSATMNSMITEFSTDQFTYSKETNCFSAEISELRTDFIDPIIKLTNPKTGNSKTFNFTNRDLDASGEDCYGWNFRSTDGIRLLIIND
jgi:hypothetical protein